MRKGKDTAKREIELSSVLGYLPDVIKDIIDLIGYKDAEKLIHAFGGVCFRFSKGNVYFEKLIDVLGQEKAHILQQRFRGEECYIPRCSRALGLLKKMRFYAEFCRQTEQKHKSARMAMMELCPKFEISDRLGWSILKEMRSGSEKSQINLF